jgi:hypothetical protein
VPTVAARDIEFWHNHIRPAIRARQISWATRVIDKLIADGYLTAEDRRRLADRLGGAA